MDGDWLVDGPSLATLGAIVGVWPIVSVGLTLFYLNAARFHLLSQPTSVALDSTQQLHWRARFVSWASCSRPITMPPTIARLCAGYAADLALSALTDLAPPRPPTVTAGLDP